MDSEQEIQRLNEEVEKLNGEIARLRSIANLTSDPTSKILVNCRNCRNHLSNGGSGICHCILGTQVGY